MQPFRRPLTAGFRSLKLVEQLASTSSARRTSPICLSCQARSLASETSPRRPTAVLSAVSASSRARPVVPHRSLADNGKPENKDDTLSRTSPVEPESSSLSPREETTSPVHSHSPDPPSSSAELPSENQAARSSVTVALHGYMDRFLNYLSFASHRVNTLTGTDYSAIAALRESIIAQEHRVKSTQIAVTEARLAYDKALATQGASQREVVQLLERKHSWSAEDLERYMSLIRSEHVNEQAVAAARDQVGQVEAKLEAVRQQVEKAERKQYHEEQIWSDTIRRNSTWVTFGLMGLNMLLLIANLVVIEPWRRRRMVRELEAAMDHRTLPGSAGSAAAAAQPAIEAKRPVAPVTDDADGIDAATDVIADEQDAQSFYPTTQQPPGDADIVYIDGHAVERPAPIAPIFDEDGNALESGRSRPSKPWRERLADLFKPSAWMASWHKFVQSCHDSLSEQDIILRKVDLTIRFAEGFALGMTFMLFTFVLFPIIEEA